MKLWYSAASPFVRKVMVTALETGQADDLDKVDANTTLIDRNLEVVKDNPSGKIPALVLDDGTVLFDSRVICAYLDSRHDGAKLVPDVGMERFKVMTLEALGDGTMEAAVAARYEMGLRPADKQWDGWISGLMDKVNSSLDDLEASRLSELSGPLNAGVISVACALGYLDFRFSDMGWRDSRPGLAKWFDEFSQRPSMQATKPG